MMQESEKEEKLGGSILDHSVIVWKIRQAWWGIFEPKSEREVLPVLRQGLNSRSCHAGRPGLRANVMIDVSM